MFIYRKKKVCRYVWEICSVWQKGCFLKIIWFIIHANLQILLKILFVLKGIFFFKNILHNNFSFFFFLCWIENFSFKLLKLRYIRMQQKLYKWFKISFSEKAGSN